MKTLKPAIAMVLAVSIIFGLSLNASASTTGSKTDNVGLQSTLRYTQEEYLANMAAAKTDAEKIEAVCTSFLTMARASVRNQKYDPSVLVADNKLKDNKVAYRLSEYKYLAALYNALNQTILSDNISFSDFSLSIDGNSAQAKIVESYEYYINDGFEGNSFRKRQYYFDLIRENAGWKISSVATNDPWENNNFNYEAIDVSKAVASIANAASEAKHKATLNANTIVNPLGMKDPGASIESLYTWTYNVGVAINYAENYYNSINPLFGQAAEDCQNFASQCVWAGLRGGYADAQDRTAIPAVSTSYVGSDAPNVWCRNQSTTYNFSYFGHKWAWDNVCGFAELIERSSSSVIGPFGNTHYGNLLYASEGDVISWDANGSPSGTTMDHAMFVTSATGTVGYRTKSDLKIAAHNSSTNSAYQTLTSYAPPSYTDSYFATSVIGWGYYDVAQ